MFFPVTSLGPSKRLGIWTRGCHRTCYRCSNPELQFFSEEDEKSVEDIFQEVKKIKPDGVTISGGEPFLWSKDLKELVELIYENISHDILIFTGFTIEELKDKKDENINYILSHISVLIDGPYVDEMHSSSRLKGSENQRILVLNKDYFSLYEEYLKQEKNYDIFLFDGENHFIGIPPKNPKEVYEKLLKERKK